VAQKYSEISWDPTKTLPAFWKVEVPTGDKMDHTVAFMQSEFFADVSEDSTSKLEKAIRQIAELYGSMLLKRKTLEATHTHELSTVDQVLL